MAASLARQAANLARLSSSSTPAAASSSYRSASLIHRRGLAGAADHHGPPRVACWKDPMNPGNWKEEHVIWGMSNKAHPYMAIFVASFVIVSLSGWGLIFFGGYKFFTGGKKKEEKLVEAAQ